MIYEIVERRRRRRKKGWVSKRKRSGRGKESGRKKERGWKEPDHRDTHRQ